MGHSYLMLSFPPQKDDLSNLSATLLPTLPNPFADLVKRSETKKTPIPEPIALPSRLLGSKVKQDKDLPIYDHLVSIKDVILSLLSSRREQTTMDYTSSGPTPKFRWALHQRTTVPWPMQPRPSARGEKPAPPVVPTDRVHLDWFTSMATTEDSKDSKAKGVDDEALPKAEQGEDAEDQGQDVGALTRLQVDGYLGEWYHVTVRSRYDRLNHLLFLWQPLEKSQRFPRPIAKLKTGCEQTAPS
jgi:hypothetical protein